MHKMTIFLDGQYKNISERTLRAMSPGILKGLGVFETLLCEDGKIFFLAEHYRRFLHGCDRYILPKPIALRKVKIILLQLLKANGLKGGRIRLAAWRKGWELHFAVMVMPRSAFSQQVYQRGFSACIYPRCFDRPFQLAKVKSLDYKFFTQAYEYALKSGHHEVVLVNSSGQIVEGSRSNIFYVKDGKLFTPSLSCGCLAGVTRQIVLDAAKSLGIKVKVITATAVDLRNSTEAFLTNALVGIMPLTCFHGHKIAGGRLGPVTKRLLKSYKNLSQKYATFLV